MIVSFAVTNHRSIRRRTEISMVAESRPTTTDRARISVPGFDYELVPVIGLFGANGAGKSNVLDALASLIDAISWSQTRWEPDERPQRSAFMTKDGPDPEPTVFELVFVHQGGVYEYVVAIGPDSVVSERLSVAPSGPRSWTLLFEREAGVDGKPAIRTGRRLQGPKAAAIAATRPNSLFLSAAAQTNHEQLLSVWRWVRRGYRSANLENRAGRGHYTAQRILESENEHDRRRILAFVKAADLGIDDVRPRREPLRDEDATTLKRLLSVVEQEPPDDGEFEMISTMVDHRGDVGTLPLDEESTGTKAWFEWAAPVLDAVHGPHVLTADELDSNLNAHLVSRIVGSFQDPELNVSGAQLIFSGQDPSTATLSGLARDQVWIVEKDLTGSSAAFSVTSARREWDVGRAFSHGRFGGLPIVDDEMLRAALRGSE